MTHDCRFETRHDVPFPLVVFLSADTYRSRLHALTICRVFYFLNGKFRIVHLAHIGSSGVRKKRKVFFFEKKKQKTFVS